MNTHTNQREIWIGLANIQVDKKNSSIKDANYGYVTVIGLATGRNNFREKITKELSAMSFRLLRLEEAEKFENRVAHYDVDESIHRLVRELHEGGEDIKFSTFHTYD